MSESKKSINNTTISKQKRYLINEDKIKKKKIEEKQ